MINMNAPVVEPIRDKIYWNSRDLLTIHELSYLLFEAEPYPYELHVTLVSEFEKYYPRKPTSPNYQDSVDKFVELMCGYNKIAVHAKSLPTEITDQTHVAWYHQEYKENVASLGYEPRFLISWIKERGFTIPSWFNPIESIYESQRKPKMQQFDNSQIMVDGWVNVRKIESTKLILAIENYVTKMHNKEVKKIESSDAVKAEMVARFGAYGVTEAMARTIDECSRHDSKANNPPNGAHKKTIFFQ